MRSVGHREALGQPSQEEVEHSTGVPQKPGLGIELDRERLAEANRLYLDHGLGTRDDSVAMQSLIDGWTFDAKRPALVR